MLSINSLNCWELLEKQDNQQQDCAFFEIFFVTLQYGKRYNL